MEARIKARQRHLNAMRKAETFGVADMALHNELSCQSKPRTPGRIVKVVMGQLTHTVVFQPDYRLEEE